MKISAQVTPQGGESDGVIVAHGGQVQGYVLYLKKGRPVLATRANSQLSVIESPVALPEQGGMVGAKLGRDGSLSLAVNGKEVARGRGKAITEHPADGLNRRKTSGYGLPPFLIRGLLASSRLTAYTLLVPFLQWNITRTLLAPGSSSIVLPCQVDL